MSDLAGISLADLLQAWTSPAILILVGAVLLLCWELAILLGVFIAHLKDRSETKDKGHVSIG